MRENSEARAYNQLEQHVTKVQGNDSSPLSHWDLHTTTTEEKNKYTTPGGIALGSIKKDMVNSFSDWWQRLIHDPESFPQSEDTPVGNMVMQKESQIYENELIKNVLSRFLNLANDSVEVLRAMKKSNKIFHEDFPGNYILEYKGNRLGMFFLRTAKGLNNSYDVSYEFNPKVKSFDWF